jgi:DNA-binding NarL/FixJ family response regulator
MHLTEREKNILRLASQGISDYKIARKINADPPNVTRSRKNAYKKIALAQSDIEWAQKNGIKCSKGFFQEALYNFFL